MICKECGHEYNEVTHKGKYGLCDDCSKPKPSAEALAKWNAPRPIDIICADGIVLTAWIVRELRTPWFKTLRKGCPDCGCKNFVLRDPDKLLLNGDVHCAKCGRFMHRETGWRIPLRG